MNKNFGNEGFMSMFKSLLLAAANYMITLDEITENEFTALNFDDGIGNKLRLCRFRKSILPGNGL